MFIALNTIIQREREKKKEKFEVQNSSWKGSRADILI
jgi:hypothetical protein